MMIATAIFTRKKHVEQIPKHDRFARGFEFLFFMHLIGHSEVVLDHGFLLNALP